ncbi:MAG: LamG domain-containing protein, partial [Flavobacteriaceae bacterium]|nr:LamG domain-containing protein [Flavobacteriaceae bacterium]
MKRKLLLSVALATSIFFTSFAQTSINVDTGYIDLGTGFSLTSYTKEAWINWADVSNSNNLISGNFTNQHAFYAPNGNMRSGHNGSWNTVIDTDDLIKDVWEHWAVTYDGTTGAMALYRNGVLKSSGTTAPGFIVTDIEIGSFNQGSFFEGLIDDVRIWEVVRTPAEIAANFNQCLTGTETGLVALYDFEDGSGLTLTDQTSNGNNGTIINVAPLPDLTWVTGNDVCLSDVVAPTVTINSTESPSTTISPIPITITFSENVTDFEESDLILGNGTASNFDGSGTTYTLDITPLADGNVTIDVPADVAWDPFYKNMNTAATQLSVAYNAAPSVVISSTETSPTNTSPFIVTITFSEDVTGFEVTDLTIGNGTADNLSGSGSIYTAEITPVADGTVSIDIAADVVEDTSTNGNSAAIQYALTYDGTAPIASAVTIISDNANTALATVGNVVTLNFTVSESLNNDPIATIDGNSAIITGGPLDWSAAYTMQTGDTAGLIAFTLDFTDTSGNAGNQVTTTTDASSVTFDEAIPTATIMLDDTDLSAGETATVTITFSEAVTGFDNDDLTVPNGTLTA